ncbi:MAG: Na+/H+ antiporter NhaA [Rhizobacter sp.]
MTDALRRFFATEAAGGILLAIATVAALVISNSPWALDYEAFRQIPGEIRIGEDIFTLAKPLILWVNDLWMAVFFLLVGLEIKRELMVGELSTTRQAMLPVVAAFGGMAVPAGIYAAINWGDAVALRGWAIPSATDIAFALGIVLLLGSRVPASLKIFLTAVAIIDDLGAILVIAFFYTDHLSTPMLVSAGVGVAVLVVLNRLRVVSVLPYLVVGTVIWLCVLKSGVHATLAGVVTAFAIPLHNNETEGAPSPLESLAQALHPWVAFVVLPMFAFANAGVSLHGLSIGTLVQTVPLGIAAGLVIGKAVGVFGASWLVSAAGLAELPSGANRWQFFGVCVLCGVGFTMSLFIGGLAFEGRGLAYDTQVKLGVLGGSLVAGALGVFVLMRAERRGPARRRHQHLRESSFLPSRIQ